MGFLDSLFGRTRLPKSNEDKLFAMSTAAVGLEATAGIKPAGRAGIVFKRLPPGRFDQLKKDITDLLKLQGEGEGLSLEDKTDDLGFDWLIMSGTDFQEAIAAIHSAAGQNPLPDERDTHHEPVDGSTDTMSRRPSRFMSTRKCLLPPASAI